MNKNELESINFCNDGDWITVIDAGYSSESFMENLDQSIKGIQLITYDEVLDAEINDNVNKLIEESYLLFLVVDLNSIKDSNTCLIIAEVAKSMQRLCILIIVSSVASENSIRAKEVTEALFSVTSLVSNYFIITEAEESNSLNNGLIANHTLMKTLPE